MKKIILLISASLLTFGVFSQSFPGEDVQLFLNVKVKPKEIDKSLQEYHYKNFYKVFSGKEFLKKKKNKPFATGKSHSPLSDYESLRNKEFIVKKIEEIPPKYSFSSKEYALELFNEELGTIYYEYDPRYEHDLELEVVGGLKLPDDFYCKKMEVKKDKFEDKTTTYTPYSSGISFMKVASNGQKSIYLSINETGSTVLVNKKGLYLLLENDKKISRPETKIDVKVNKSGSGYIYNAFIRLTDEEIELLKENRITDNRLYIFDGTVKKDSADKIIGFLKCLTK